MRITETAFEFACNGALILVPGLTEWVVVSLVVLVKTPCEWNTRTRSRNTTTPNEPCLVGAVPRRGPRIHFCCSYVFRPPPSSGGGGVVCETFLNEGMAAAVVVVPFVMVKNGSQNDLRLYRSCISF